MQEVRKFQPKLQFNMRAKPFQILWHQKLPIFSVDFERFQGENVTEQRLATAGGDNVVRVGYIYIQTHSMSRTFYVVK